MRLVLFLEEKPRLEGPVAMNIWQTRHGTALRQQCRLGALPQLFGISLAPFSSLELLFAIDKAIYHQKMNVSMHPSTLFYFRFALHDSIGFAHWWLPLSLAIGHRRQSHFYDQVIHLVKNLSLI